MCNGLFQHKHVVVSSCPDNAQNKNWRHKVVHCQNLLENKFQSSLKIKYLILNLHSWPYNWNKIFFISLKKICVPLFYITPPEIISTRCYLFNFTNCNHYVHVIFFKFIDLSFNFIQFPKIKWILKLANATIYFLTFYKIFS